MLDRTKRRTLIADHNFIVGRRAILRRCWPLLGALMLATFACAQSPPNTPALSSDATANPWAFSLTTSGYIVPGGQSYVSPDLSADHSTLHFEGRYNNEALKTGSFWIGYNFTVGKKLVLNLTPMAGAVFGSLNGVAPGYLFTLTYKRVQLYSNGEFVFDAQNRGRDFFL